ncbi:hypothetical protein QBC37DRAFT_271623 [Rhypophila decipiens]|uniref:Pyrroloquinoline quinone-dependent pyranose dehydrogenase beta-propeller domain-containing protein n=1 Tax=Rhypophila decipiens TaxID=261697 RepID=A0AAN6YKP5_9PEZI|nr:hypothetical protein QBC37DRAFT_271623 [Rhypophila decipiens]
MANLIRRFTIVALLLALGADAQSCSRSMSPSYPAPVVAEGYAAQLIISGLTKPRSILFDTKGALLVVESGVGITHITLQDDGNTCIGMGNTTTLVDNKELNHGIDLSQDGKTLYASTESEVFSWTYDPVAATASNPRTLINGMSTSGHSTRTLLLSKKQPDILLVSQGSAANIDPQATDMRTGISQIRSFNLTELKGKRIYNYTDGTVLGWGLRNSVGVAEEPITGGIFSVENSADQVTRKGVDIHENNPGEEMNFHGFLNGTMTIQSANHGYPGCLAVWGTDIPDVGNMTVGWQFSHDASSDVNDDLCMLMFTPPRLTFQAHTAPLDIKFNPNGTLAYVSFHGSWNRDDPAGYMLSVIAFANGEPTEPRTSITAAVPILSNQDPSACPGNCFRPVGLAFDSQERLFMTSDSTGEIYVVVRTSADGSGVPSNNGGSSDQGGGNNGGGGGIGNENAATTGAVVPRSYESLLLVGVTLTLSLVGGAFFAVG